MSKRNLGSVFLGDSVQHMPQHLVNLPLSPPPHRDTSTLNPPEPSLDGQTEEGDDEEEEDQTIQIPTETKPLDLDPITPIPVLESTQVAVSPELSLELRTRWLETLILGLEKDGSVAQVRDPTSTVVRKVNDARRVLDDTINMNESLRKFMSVYDRNAHLLTPSFAHGLTHPDATSSSDLEALLVESEADIRAADRDLKEIVQLEAKGVLDAGNLPSHEGLKPRLDVLVQAHLEDLARFDALEERTARLIATYSARVDGLSELFVAWDGALDQAEGVVGRLEKERERKKETSFD